MNPALAAARKHSHRFAVALKDNVKKFRGRVANPAVDQLRALVGRDFIDRLGLEANRVFQSAALEGEHPLNESVFLEHCPPDFRCRAQHSSKPLIRE